MSALGEILRTCKAIFLDFDGPVCRVFAGVPPSTVASELLTFLSDQGIHPPEGYSANPLKLLAWVGEQHPHLSRVVDDRLRDAETLAVDSAAPTPHTEHLLALAHRQGIPLAIVSNNAHEAIEQYLTRHNLATYVALVVGRVPGNPALLKPHPRPVRCAVEQLGMQPSECALVGDSHTDVVAAHAVGVRVIGYAKTPERRPRLIAAGADAVVEDMGDIAMQMEAA